MTFPLGSWADTNRHHEFRDNIRYWPHSTNNVIPLWATQSISAKQLNLTNHHMTKEAIQRIYDTPDLKSFPCNTGFYTTQIDLTKEVRRDGLPLGIRLTEVSIDRFTKIGANHAHTVDLPFGLLPVLEITLNIIEEKPFNPLGHEKEDRKARKLYSMKHAHNFWHIDIDVMGECEQEVLFRAIVFSTYNRATGLRRTAKIPWIHLPMFNFYFSKMCKDLNEHEEVFDSRNGQGACKAMYKRSK